MINKQFCWLWN